MDRIKALYPERKVVEGVVNYSPTNNYSTFGLEPRDVLSSLYSFPKETGCGSDQLRAQHLVDMLKSKHYGQKIQVEQEIVKW